MKKIIIPGILFVIAMLMIPAGAAGVDEMQLAYPENDTGGYVPVDIIVIDPAIKSATPDHVFLVLDTEGKKTYLENIDADIDILYAANPEKEAKKAGLKARLKRNLGQVPGRI
ncbi:MAG: hypothetical protein PHF57_05630 [Methanoregula sp.]|jgi:hypothetical protein|nr:hypothetical protein [Methanoregula sp.]